MSAQLFPFLAFCCWFRRFVSICGCMVYHFYMQLMHSIFIQCTFVYMYINIYLHWWFIESLIPLSDQAFFWQKGAARGNQKMACKETKQGFVLHLQHGNWKFKRVENSHTFENIETSGMRRMETTRPKNKAFWYGSTLPAEGRAYGMPIYGMLVFSQAGVLSKNGSFYLQPSFLCPPAFPAWDGVAD